MEWHKKLTPPEVVLKNLAELARNARPSSTASAKGTATAQLFPDIGSRDVNATCQYSAWPDCQGVPYPSCDDGREIVPGRFRRFGDDDEYVVEGGHPGDLEAPSCATIPNSEEQRTARPLQERQAAPRAHPALRDQVQS